MEEKTLKIGEKSYTIKELKYKDFIAAVADMSKSDMAKSLLVSSTGITDEEYDNLSMKDGIALINIVNEVNGLVDADFQQVRQIKN